MSWIQASERLDSPWIRHDLRINVDGTAIAKALQALKVVLRRGNAHTQLLELLLALLALICLVLSQLLVVALFKRMQSCFDLITVLWNRMISAMSFQFIGLISFEPTDLMAKVTCLCFFLCIMQRSLCETQRNNSVMYLCLWQRHYCRKRRLHTLVIADDDATACCSNADADASCNETAEC
jgi:hypothetical protein